MFYKMKLYVSFNILFQFPTKCGPQPCEIQKAHFTIHQVKMTPAACCHACTAGIMYYTWPGSHGRPDHCVVRYLMASILSTWHATHWPVFWGEGRRRCAERRAAVDSAHRATAATEGAAEGRSPSTTHEYEYRPAALGDAGDNSNSTTYFWSWCTSSRIWTRVFRFVAPPRFLGTGLRVIQQI